MQDELDVGKLMPSEPLSPVSYIAPSKSVEGMVDNFASCPTPSSACMGEACMRQKMTTRNTGNRMARSQASTEAVCRHDLINVVPQSQTPVSSRAAADRQLMYTQLHCDQPGLADAPVCQQIDLADNKGPPSQGTCGRACPDLRATAIPPPSPEKSPDCITYCTPPQDAEASADTAANLRGPPDQHVQSGKAPTIAPSGAQGRILQESIQNCPPPSMKGAGKSIQYCIAALQ